MLSEGHVALSFSGCGFLGTYHLGSATCLVKHAPKLLARTNKVAGASAGALVAAVLALCPDRIEDCVQQLYTLADEVNNLSMGALTPGFSLVQKLETLVDRTLPPDCQKANDYLHISLTKLADRSNRLERNFSGRERLIRCLIASCFIPIYAGPKEMVPKLEDGEYVDGGLSNNLPKFPELRTVTISPFTGEAEISPNDQEQKTPMFDWRMTLANQVMKVNLKNLVRGAQALFPPRRPVLEHYYVLGYRDTMRFLLDNQCFERQDGSEPKLQYQSPNAKPKLQYPPQNAKSKLQCPPPNAKPKLQYPSPNAKRKLQYPTQSSKPKLQYPAPNAMPKLLYPAQNAKPKLQYPPRNPMSILTVLARKLVGFLHWLLACVKRLLCFMRKRTKQDDSLPYVVTHQSDAPLENWDRFTDPVSDRIQAYRMRMQMERRTSGEEGGKKKETDFFTDMTPEVKSSKVLLKGARTKRSPGDRFAVSADQEIPSGAELGLLDENESNTHWECDDDMDEVLREAKKLARQQKRKERNAPTPAAVKKMQAVRISLSE